MGKNFSSFGGHKYKDVQTVDACCFFIRKDMILKYGFWDKLDGFHMYVEELCLRLIKDNYKVVVIPADIWHFSSGASLNYIYYREMAKVLRKYFTLDYINTTSFQWKVSYFSLFKLKFYELRNFVHHKIILRK